MEGFDSENPILDSSSSSSCVDDTILRCFQWLELGSSTNESWSSGEDDYYVYMGDLDKRSRTQSNHGKTQKLLLPSETPFKGRLGDTNLNAPESSSVPSLCADNIWAYNNPSYEGKAALSSWPFDMRICVSCTKIINVVTGTNPWEEFEEVMVPIKKTKVFPGMKDCHGLIKYHLPKGIWDQGLCWDCFIVYTKQLLENFDLVELAKTPVGSQRLQNILQSQDPIFRKTILSKVSDSLIDLMNDSHGVNVFDKLVDYCNDSEMENLVLMLTVGSPSIVDAAFTRNGSRAIQRLVDLIKDLEIVNRVILAISGGIFELMTDRNGRHVIFKCFRSLSRKKKQALLEQLLSHWLEIAQHKEGCISLNMFIDNIQQPKRDLLLEHISQDSLFLSQDTSGNFIVQHVLELGHPLYNPMIAQRLRGHYARLSLTSLGSHVIEKCIRYSALGFSFFMEEIIKEKGLLQKLAQDQFGNYVVQRALDISKQDARFYAFFVQSLKSNEFQLGRTKGGKHVLNKMKRLSSTLIQVGFR